MKVKLSLVFILFFLGFSGFIFYKIQYQKSEKILLNNEQQTYGLLEGQIQQVEREVLHLERWLEPAERLVAVDAVYKLQIKGSRFEVVHSNYGESGQQENYDAPVKKLLEKIRETEQTQFYFMKDAQKKDHIAVFLSQASDYFLILVSPQFLQRILEGQKNIRNEYMILNTQAEVLAHSKREYIGTRAQEHPLFQKASGSTRPLQGIQYSHQEGEKWGTFATSSHANLYFLSSASLESMRGEPRQDLQQLLMMTAGILLLSIGLIAVLVDSEEKDKRKNLVQLQVLQQKLRHIESEKSQNQRVVLTPQEKENEKFASYARIAASIAFEIRTPLTSILAYAQSLLNHVKDADSIHWVENILKEARQVRGVLDKMFVFAGIRENQKTNTKIEGVLLKALKDLDFLMKEKGVLVKKEFKSNASFLMNMESMERVFRNLIENAVESMERMPKKELFLSTEDDGDWVKVVLQDSGEGIESDKKEKIFDPFYTTRSYQKHLGLGLTVVGALLKEQNATIELQSERSKGTRVEIRFSIQEQQVATQQQVGDASSQTERIAVEPVVAVSLDNVPGGEKLSITPKEAPMNMDVDKLFEFSENEGEEGSSKEGVEASDSPDLNASTDEKDLLPGFEGFEKNISAASQNVLTSFDEVTAVVEPEAAAYSENHKGSGMSEPGPEMQMHGAASEVMSFSVQIRRPGKR